MPIAYQGEPGAYSEEAALKYFGADIDTYACPTFDGVFAAVQSEVCEYGMVPIENSLAGNIERNYDLLYRHPLSIVGEHFLRIQHCLIAHPGVTLPELRHVISHPQGLAQCDLFLQTLPNVTTEAVYDTAGGVKMVREKAIDRWPLSLRAGLPRSMAWKFWSKTLRTIRSITHASC